jgi:hypothetical protein
MSRHLEEVNRGFGGTYYLCLQDWNLSHVVVRSSETLVNLYNVKPHQRPKCILQNLLFNVNFYVRFSSYAVFFFFFSILPIHRFIFSIPHTSFLYEPFEMKALHWIRVLAARVWSYLKSCKICGELSCTRTGFLIVFRFPLPILFHSFSVSFTILLSTLYNWHSGTKGKTIRVTIVETHRVVRRRGSNIF